MNELNAFDNNTVPLQNRPFNLYKLLADIITIKLYLNLMEFEFH